MSNYDFQHERAQQAAQSAIQANFDAKKFLCGPWLNGARGGPWTQVFKPAFENAMRKEKDSFATLYNHFISETGVGAHNGVAHPAGGGALAALNFQSVQSYQTRDQASYGHILTHIGYDQSIKEQIENHVRNVLTGSPSVAAATAAEVAIAAAHAANNAALAAAAAGGPAAVLIPIPPPAAGVAGQLPVDWVGQLYRWIDTTLGQARPSGLLTSSQNTQFEQFKITDVGVQRDTLRLAYAALDRLNKQRTVPLEPLALWIKYLGGLTFPKMLNEESIRQLQRPTFLLPPGHAHAGQPDLAAFVTHAEEIWHVLYDRGEIKPVAAPKLLPVERSNRVDGMSVQIGPEFVAPEGTTILERGRASDYAWNGLTQDELREAYLVRADQGATAFAFVKDERNCWTCKGFGHTKDKCPSDPKVRRPFGACIEGLQALKSSQDARLREFTKRRIIRRPGRSPAVSARAAIESEGAVSEEPLIQYDDGAIYSPDGEMLSPPAPIGEPSTSADEATTVDAKPAILVPDVPSNVTAKTLPSHAEKTQPIAAVAETTPSPAGTETLPNGTANAVAYCDLDSTIERDFNNSVPSYMAQCSPATEDIVSEPAVSMGDAFERFEPEVPRSSHAIKGAIAGALTATALILGSLAIAARSTKGKMVLSLLSIASGSHGALVGKGIRNPFEAHHPQVKIHSSEFSRSQCFTNATTMQQGPVQMREHGTMDTGSTECCSGRRKLFPDDGVEQWHPRVRVEIASGICLPVLLRGTMLMRVRPFNRTSAKKYVTIRVPHSLHVPKMPVTLVSTKALFNYCNISTYFNDQLCMVLPDGEIVGFVETATSYTVVFDDDSTDVQHTRVPNVTRYPWSTATTSVSGERALVRSTLRQPEPLTWDLMHQRLNHSDPERIWRSAEYIIGIDVAPLGAPPRHKRPCNSCIRGAFRGHRKLKRPAGKYIRFGQRVYSDSCAMPKSTPFGFIYMYIFYDAATKYIAVYFGKTTTSAEMLQVCKQFITDHLQWLPKKHVEEWYADGGPEFKSAELDTFCAEMHTRRRFIAPWNPWMNVAETGWRIILRPLRIILAANNVNRSLWPFAVNHIVTVHNALSSSSDSSNHTDESSFAVAFANSLVRSRAPPSPYYMVTGKPFDLTNFRVLFCEVVVRVRNKDDLRRMYKTDPLTYTGIYLGHSKRIHGPMVYIESVQRFTTASYTDTYFNEHVRPRCDRIVGTFDIDGLTGTLPTEEQQVADTSGIDFPELDLPLARPVGPGEPAVAPHAEQPARTADHGDDIAFRRNHCSNSNCEYDAGHDGPCSDVVDAAARPRRPGLTLRDHTRDVSNVVAAVEGDDTNTLAASTHNTAYAVAVAGDGDNQVLICYNVAAPDSMSCSDEPPSSTREALNGPNADEWRRAYQKDLAAKIKNKAFTYVPRPPRCKVIKTKVAHAHKREDQCNPNLITEYRARWVGMGFLQGPNQFNATYCATPSATSCRMFLNFVMVLNLTLCKGDVTKAFTLNPIDVELYVEQMPGMEVAGDWKGATKENTVCLLHKCLEGLKQAGNVWQYNHSGFLDGLHLPEFQCKIVQSIIEPTMFIGHCSKGIIAILVWVDDILVAWSSEAMYEAFVRLYMQRFPSKHERGCTKYAGLSIMHRPNHSITIHQSPHIVRAYEKFVTDKAAAAKSPFIHKPAVSDRDSPLHYSKLSMAANDAERTVMKQRPFLAALATMMYVTHFTLPHLCYHTSFLGQFMHDPSPAGYDAVIALIIYAYHNRDTHVIVYGGILSVPRVIPQRRRQDFQDSFGFHGYCDASWLLRTPAGYVLMLFNGPVDWASKLIRVLCHSTAEAEISAGCMLGKRVVFAVQFASDFKIDLKVPVMLLIDNTAADDLSGKFGVTPKTAHFLRWQFYLRWLVIHKWVEIVFVPTKEQLADIFTKVIDMSTFIAACKILFQCCKSTK